MTLSVSIYTDGSYHPDKYLIGCAILIMFETNKNPIRIAYSKTILESQGKYGSNIAELLAVKTAIKTAISNGYSEIDIYYDWTGIEFFSHSENIRKHPSDCPSFSKYANYIECARKKLKINFVKVKAHSGNVFNSYVDEMAKRGRIIRRNSKFS
jgi:ribonuclease H-related protein